MCSLIQIKGNFDVSTIEVANVAGLFYVSNYLDQAQSDLLLQEINSAEWLGDLKRRVQHYGYKYDYKARRIDSSMRLGELPKYLKLLTQKLCEDGIMPYLADQVIVNEYQPGQGISSHIDCEPCFDDTIVSLSLGSACVMNFTNKADKTQVVPVVLGPRSLVIMQGDARYKWLHSIPARQKDVINGESKNRERRISLTFRKIKQES